jgi:hypothetical protein
VRLTDDTNRHIPLIHVRWYSTYPESYEIVPDAPITQAKKEIDRLAEYLMKNHPTEIGADGRNEGAVDVAIRLLSKPKKK